MVCPFCEKIRDKSFLDSSFLIREFAHSYLIVGDHQTFPGYSVLFLKEHIKEAFDMGEDRQIAVQKELMHSAAAIRNAFNAEKINLSNYGNMTPHQHWHIFPRQKTDKNWPQPPWTLMSEFDKNKTLTDQAADVRKQILKFLK